MPAAKRNRRSGGRRYLASFMSGIEPLVGSLLPRVLPGARLRHIEPGYVLFDYAGAEAELVTVPLFNNLFRLLYEGRALPFERLVEEVGRRRLSHGQVEGTFRLRFQHEGRLTRVAPETMARAERIVAEATGARPDRVNPDTEFWYITRRSGAAWYGRRLARQRRTERDLAPGELRPELAWLLVALARPRAGEVLLDPFAGSGAIGRAAADFAFKRMYLSDMDAARVDSWPQEARFVGMVADARRLEAIPDGSVDAIVTDPPWGLYEAIDVAGLYRDFVAEAGRVLRDRGRLILLSGAVAQWQQAAEAEGFQIAGRWDILVNGRQAAIFACMKGR
ncbi:MAG: methyltransferase [Bacillota bacterium]|nr:methyltransferase [Bacillota bacterium]